MGGVPEFRVGDPVIWTSQAQGHIKTKQGVVLEIVPAGLRPSAERFPSLYKGAGAGSARKNLSYVVRANGRVYWPIASNLRRASGAEAMGMVK